MYLRAFRTYKSVVMYSYISKHSELTSQWLCTHVSQSSQNLQVSSYVLMYLRAVRTYKSVVMYSCISEHSELTSQLLCTHASLSIQTLQVSSYVLMYLRAFRTSNDFPTCYQFRSRHFVSTYGHSLVVHFKMAASELLTCREVIGCSECSEIHEYITTDL